MKANANRVCMQFDEFMNIGYKKSMKIKFDKAFRIRHAVKWERNKIISTSQICVNLNRKFQFSQKKRTMIVE